MMKKMIRKNEENTFCLLNIQQGMVRCAVISASRRSDDMTIRVEEYISVDILNPYPRLPQNENSFDLKMLCTKL